MTAVPDDVLRDLLLMYERREQQADLSLTVMIGGTLVTGLLIGEGEYFSRVGTMFAGRHRDWTQRAATRLIVSGPHGRTDACHRSKA